MAKKRFKLKKNWKKIVGGILVLILLIVGLLVGRQVNQKTRIESQAYQVGVCKGLSKVECKAMGCVDDYYKCKYSKADEKCKIVYSKTCKEVSDKELYTCSGECIVKGDCAEMGMIYLSGSCLNGVCCGEVEKLNEPDVEVVEEAEEVEVVETGLVRSWWKMMEIGVADFINQHFPSSTATPVAEDGIPQ
ncbi:MAG: hypothetical protein ABIJ43_00820 [Candidatus Beckwithbacteria bacterium]